MHHCLQISEILTQVFQHVADDVFGICTMPAVACSCQIFYEPAMDVLWGTLPNLSPVVKCLPSHLWYETTGPELNSVGNSVRTLYFHRTPAPSDWDLVMKNAQRVKVINRNSQSGWRTHTVLHSVSPEALHVIVAYCSSRAWALQTAQCFLPNLTELKLEINRYEEGTVLKYYPYLVNSTLSNLIITIATVPEDQGPSLHADRRLALRDFARRCPHLQQFVFTIYSEELYDIDKEISQEIAALPLLRTFSANTPLTPAGLAHLIHKPSLQEATLTLPRSNTTQMLRLISARSAFTTLQLLHLLLEDLTLGTKVLDSMISTGLMSLEVLYTIIPTLGTTIHDFLDTLRRQQSIRKIWVFFRAGLEEEVNSSIVVMPATFEPLFKLVHLVEVVLNLPMVVDLDDSCLDAMASAWPHITYLNIHSIVKTEFEPQATLGGLLPFAARCPHLQDLGIAFRICLPSDDLRGKAKALGGQRALDSLELFYSSPIQVETLSFATVYEFLNDLFPMFERMEFGRNLRGEPREWEDKWDQFRGYAVPLLKEKEEKKWAQWRT